MSDWFNNFIYVCYYIINTMVRQSFRAAIASLWEWYEYEHDDIIIRALINVSVKRDFLSHWCERWTREKVPTAVLRDNFSLITVRILREIHMEPAFKTIISLLSAIIKNYTIKYARCVAYFIKTADYNDRLSYNAGFYCILDIFKVRFHTRSWICIVLLLWCIIVHEHTSCFRLFHHRLTIWSRHRSARYQC